MQNKTKEQALEYWKKYWATVTGCTAYPDGRTEIRHIDGDTEFLNVKGKNEKKKERGSD